MSVETKQELIEVIRNETEIGGNTCERIATAFTESNQEKLEKNGTNLSQSDIEALRIKLGIYDDDSNENHIDLIGEITTSSDSVTINMSDSGVNKVTLGGIAYYTYAPSEFSFTPVSEDQIKVLIIYALSTVELFYLAEGEEGYEAIEPTIPDGAFFIKRITVTSDGQVIDPELISGLKEKIEDNWKKVIFNKGTTFYLDFNDKRQSFYLNPSTRTSSFATIISGITFSEESTRAFDFHIYNNSNVNININTSSTSGLSKGFSAINTPFVLKPKTTVFVKYDPETNLLDILKPAGAIATVNVTGPITGNGDDIALDILQASSSQRGSMSAAHWSKLEGINLSDYVTNVTYSAAIANRYVITTTNITAPDSTYLYALITDSLGIVRRLNLSTYLSNTREPLKQLRYGSQNPPTLAQLTTLGIQRGEYYVQTSDGTSSGTEIQRTSFNGIQLTEWTVTTAVYNAMSTDQKNAIKNLNITA
ncbi:hypothetical protein [Epilithonimonas caeni]|uniref:hypothetical protein n=1 Tax=Epilithonimonas caeni TaxID=365343 RepID=UPI0004288462|nr:hypothetical protein [Epilithonimonas caeni]